MYNILTLNKIAAIGTSRLGDNYKYGDDVQNPDAVLVRSAARKSLTKKISVSGNSVTMQISEKL